MNSSKILCLSWLSASLKNIRSKRRPLSCPQHFFWRFRAGNSEVHGQMWPEFELDQDFMAVLITDKTWGCCHIHNIFTCAQGQVTLKSMNGCGRNSNLSQILWLSWLLASLMIIQSKMRTLLCPQHFLHYESMGKIFGAQGQVTLKWVVRPGPKSNLSEILCLSCLPASLKKNQSNTEGAIESTRFVSGTQGQVTSKLMDGRGRNSTSSEILWLSCLPASLMIIFSKMRVLSCPQHFLHYKSMGKSLGAQGQITPKWVVKPGPKSNSSEILCLSLLSASLKKIQSKLKAISCPHFFQLSRAGNSKVNRWMWPKFELIQESKAVLVTCKFDEDPIQNEGTIVSTIFSPL